MYSTAFSRYYDQLMGDYSTIVNTTKLLVTQYLPRGSSLLELGCGTGNILNIFKDTYTLSGLDNSRGMLELAEKKVPDATYYQGDMTSFRQDIQYDGILCIFDTINHLSKLKEWQRLLMTVHKHLKPGGIFIFDMNTKKRLDRLSLIDPYVGKLDRHTLTCVKIIDLKKNAYDIKFQIFEDIHKDTVVYTEEIVRETAFPTEEIKDLLLQQFTLEKMVDPIRKRITVNTGRIFFVCRRK